MNIKTMNLLFWLLRKFYNIDILSLLNENINLKEEKGRNLSLLNSFQKENKQPYKTLDEMKRHLEDVETGLLKEKNKSFQLAGSVVKLNYQTYRTPIINIKSKASRIGN